MNTVRANATASTRATIYQFCLAVDKCYLLRPGQKLLIEELGDITVEGESQIEVKAYSDELSDGHPNFWNTITNWLDPKFPSGAYQSLILLTTQSFSPTATLASWNVSTSQERLSLLLNILEKSEMRAAKRAEDKTFNISKTVAQQRKILNPLNRRGLLEIIEKIVIETGCEEMSELYVRIRNERSMGILKKDRFIESLIGFVCFPEKNKKSKWEITYEDFDILCQELVNLYCTESRIFPTQFYDDFDEDSIDESRSDLFIEKIRDIDHHIFLSYAIKDYEAAIHTIASDFENHVVRLKYYDSFRREAKKQFEISYDTARRGRFSSNEESQKFYNNCQVSSPPIFTGYDGSHTWFRNEIIHMCMNNDRLNLKWNLINS